MKHLDRLYQEINVGDIIVITSSGYRGQEVDLAFVEELKPKSINVLINTNRGQLYSFNLRNVNKKCIKLPPTKENRQLFFKDLKLEDDKKNKLLQIIMEYDKSKD